MLRLQSQSSPWSCIGFVSALGKQAKRCRTQNPSGVATVGDIYPIFQKPAVFLIVLHTFSTRVRPPVVVSTWLFADLPASASSTQQTGNISGNNSETLSCGQLYQASCQGSVDWNKLDGCVFQCLTCEVVSHLLAMPCVLPLGSLFGSPHPEPGTYSSAQTIQRLHFYSGTCLIQAKSSRNWAAGQNLYQGCTNKIFRGNCLRQFFFFHKGTKRHVPDLAVSLELTISKLSPPPQKTLQHFLFDI